MIPPLPALSCTAPPPGLVKHKHRETINKGNVGRMPRRAAFPAESVRWGNVLSLSLSLLFFTRISNRCGSPRVKPRWLCGSRAFSPGTTVVNPWRKDRKAEMARPSHRVCTLRATLAPLTCSPRYCAKLFSLFVSTYRGNFGESGESAEDRMILVCAL